ncbi:MAG: hypothetical protein ACE366_23260 [Bradymonadia bacterium]
MTMKQVTVRFGAVAMLWLTVGCEYVEEKENHHRHHTEGQHAWGGNPDEPWDDGGHWDEEPWGGEACEGDGDCASGDVCDPQVSCVPPVLHCPATDACLGDPAGGAEYGLGGLDPRYVGPLWARGLSGQLVLDVTFFPDALVGTAHLLTEWGEWIPLAVGGNREGAAMSGQMADVTAHDPAAFQGLFDATLVSGSEIEGRIEIALGDRRVEGTFHLLRVSACGCDPEAPPAEAPPPGADDDPCTDEVVDPTPDGAQDEPPEEDPCPDEHEAPEATETPEAPPEADPPEADSEPAPEPDEGEDDCPCEVD